MSDVDEAFEATGIRDADRWKFSDPHLHNLVELVDEHGADGVYSMDPHHVSEQLFGNGTTVDVDVEIDHFEELGPISQRFVENFVDVSAPEQVSDLYDDPSTFEELVRKEVGESADSEAIRKAIDQKNQ